MKPDRGDAPSKSSLTSLKHLTRAILQLSWQVWRSYETRHYHRPPLSKSVGDDLFELRHVGKLNTRVLYFFVKGQRIITVHGIRNKSKKIPARDRKVALDRKRDWLARNPL